MAKILIAASKLALPPLCEALVGHDLFQAEIIQQAEESADRESIDLFVVGVHFDDSRAMELVQALRSKKQYRATPIIVVRLTPTEIKALIKQTMDTMKSLRVISDYLELEGDPLTPVKIRDTVSSHLAKRKRKSASSFTPKNPFNL